MEKDDDVCGAGATRGGSISLVLEDGREKHRSRSVMREMRILLTTSDLFFLYHPPTPSGSLAVRRSTRVRGVGAGLRLARAASGSNGAGSGVKSPQRHITWHHQASATKLSLCVMARRTRRAHTSNASARAHATHAHARTLAAARRRCLACDISALFQVLTRQRVLLREATAHGPTTGVGRLPLPSRDHGPPVRGQRSY